MPKNKKNKKQRKKWTTQKLPKKKESSVGSSELDKKINTNCHFQQEFTFEQRHVDTARMLCSDFKRIYEMYRNFPKIDIVPVVFRHETIPWNPITIGGIEVTFNDSTKSIMNSYPALCNVKCFNGDSSLKEYELFKQYMIRDDMNLHITNKAYVTLSNQ